MPWHFLRAMHMEKIQEGSVFFFRSSSSTQSIIRLHIADGRSPLKEHIGHTQWSISIKWHACQPMHMGSPLLRIGSFAPNMKRLRSKVAQRSFGTTQRYNASFIQYNTSRSLRFYKISDIGHTGKTMESWRYTKIESKKTAYKKWFVAHQTILRQHNKHSHALNCPRYEFHDNKSIGVAQKSDHFTFFSRISPPWRIKLYTHDCVFASLKLDASSMLFKQYNIHSHPHPHSHPKFLVSQNVCTLLSMLIIVIVITCFVLVYKGLLRMTICMQSYLSEMLFHKQSLIYSMAEINSALHASMLNFNRNWLSELVVVIIPWTKNDQILRLTCRNEF